MKNSLMTNIESKGVKMIKIAVCDDNYFATTEMEDMLYKICAREGVPVDIDIFYDGVALEKEIDKGEKYDLLYLDIQMKKSDGITAAKKLRKVDENAIIVFVSSYERYMMELFRLDVFAFIKKPIDKENFINIFCEAYRKIQNKNFYFIFHYRNEEFKIPCKEILYFESRGRQITVHTLLGENRIFNGKLSDVENRLESGKVPFLRIHQSFLVNYHLIKARSKLKVTMITGETLPISEERQKEFSIKYGMLLGGEISV